MDNSRLALGLRAFFVDIERRFPVAEWRIGELHVWPLVRIDLYTRLAQASMRAGPESQATPQVASREPRLAPLLRAGRAALAGSTKTERADVLLFSDGISYVPVAGRPYERFCDPVAELYAEEGRTSLCLDPREGPAGKDEKRWIRIGTGLERARLRSKINSVLARRRRQVQLERYDEFVADVRLRQSVVPLALADLLRSVDIIQAYAGVFSRILARVQPAVAFQVSFYSQIGMALNLACWRAGIPVVDLQHGVAGDANPAYGYWTVLPDGGYRLLPRVFWCWSEDEARAITAWAGDSGHRAVVGGNLFPEFCIAGRSRFDEGQAARARRMLDALGAADGRQWVLFTMQPNYLTDLPWRFALNALIEATAAWLTWCVRLHPMMRNEIDSVRQALPAAAREHLDAATGSPLYLLLANADLHATHSSATVLEAEQFDVPSLILSESGAEFFALAIERGKATDAGPQAGWAAHLIELANNAKMTQHGGIDALRSRADAHIAEALLLLDELVHPGQPA